MTNLRECHYIGVAIGFDAIAPDLIKFAGSVAVKLKKDLALIHVVEPWLGPTMTWSLGAPGTLLGASELFDQNAKELADSRLTELASLLPQTLKIKKVNVIGPVAEMINEEVTKLKIGLMIVGKKPGGALSGFSTALSLMGSAPCPVLVMGADQFNRPQVEKLLLADDLSSNSGKACEFAYEFAGGLAPSKMFHIHVSGITKDSLKTALELSANASHTPQIPLDSVDKVYHEVQSALLEKLRQRACQVGRDVEQNVSVRAGQVQDELGAAVAEFKPGVLVFGRHKRVHTKPFFIGRVPFKSMLAMNLPVLVVPEVES